MAQEALRRGKASKEEQVRGRAWLRRVCREGIPESCALLRGQRSTETLRFACRVADKGRGARILLRSRARACSLQAYKASTALCTPLHACTRRETPARDRHSGVSELRSGRSLSFRRIRSAKKAVSCGIWRAISENTCQKTSNTPRSSQNTCIQSECRRNRGDT